MLATIFGSKLRAKVLVYLFTHTDDRFYVRQLTALIVEDSTNVSRELARLENIGILVSTVEGKQKYYQVNRKSPVFKQIKGLMTQMNALEPPAPKSSPDRLNQRLRVDKRKLAAFCRQNHIRTLSLFGSVLRDDFKPESDIDVLVEFQPGQSPGFLQLGSMEEELSQLTGGRKVDLRTPQDLSKQFRDRVLKEAVVLCR
jgi:predicted nucleotidyltransferase/predicted transcriptional regulator with HTH domain